MEQIISKCLHLFKSCSNSVSLHLSSTDVWGQALLCCGDCPVPSGMVSSIPGLYLPDTTVTECDSLNRGTSRHIFSCCHMSSRTQSASSSKITSPPQYPFCGLYGYLQLLRSAAENKGKTKWVRLQVPQSYFNQRSSVFVLVLFSKSGFIVKLVWKQTDARSKVFFNASKYGKY